ncbi:MAG: bifunctional phosphoribosylaminoimidazolecarboxamide formyltransferase/IMP cyclohydrolase [Saprospiraceae bacterium]|nr:bifunctional phosphoribosylaminoimidazolecarboxamide formyltransferase/IMP cyclohydrolase [Saprospiraceae bacterium]
MKSKKIHSALISVFHKEGLDAIIKRLDALNVTIYSTGGTEKYIQDQGVEVARVEDLTSYPSILSGRVKTLHPKVFGGILARREDDHLAQLAEYDIPEIDLVIVDLYPFEKTVASTDDESAIIEKIDIGGISLIRAAAKNYQDVLVVASQAKYADLEELLDEKMGQSNLSDRKQFAKHAFSVSAGYDTAIHDFFSDEADLNFQKSINGGQVLRYGENPHQKGVFHGQLGVIFDKLGGKELSYNNLVDVDAAVSLMREFADGDPAFAILKHTNACGVSIRKTILEAWEDALAGDPISAFGGILISNQEIDLPTAEAIDKIFYEVLIAPSFSEDAQAHLLKKKKRILLKIKSYAVQDKQFKSLLNGIIQQDMDLTTEQAKDLKVATKKQPSEQQVDDLLFAAICAKHLKSNTIVLAKNNQLLSMGCGQTSRVDALKQAIVKAQHFNFDLNGAVMASDAFFPFPDCVEIADQAGICAVIQPGGSIKDNESIAYCDEHDMAMVLTGVRHFKH